MSKVSRGSTAAGRHPQNAPVVELDVREDLRSGREPFSRIMGVVAALREGEVLRLRAIFEPAPLFTVLAKRGFAHESQAHAADDWSAWFWRPLDGAASEADETSPRPPNGDVPPNDERTIHLDVRGLNPPDPMVRTLAALESLEPGHALVQVNQRVPQFLLPALAERGFSWEIDESRPGRVLVRISRPSQSPKPTGTMATIAKELDVRVIPPRDKHPTIFRTFDDLSKGQSMVIINDHDPKPLRYQLAAERPNQFEWTYEATGPEVWRVKIDRL